MAIPANASLTTVTETYIFQDGTSTGIPASGTVTFRPSNSIYVNDPGNAIFPPATVTGTLDAGGTFSVELIAADDTDINPTGWTYDVTENLSVGATALPPRTYSISVPTSVDPIRLSSIAPAPPSGGSTGGLVTSVNNVDPDISGNVTLTAAEVGASPTGAYVKPGTGIPSTDMTSAVQTSLSKADSAVQPTNSTLTGALQSTNNLSDVASPTSARTNLGLGGAATLSVGTGAGTVAAGNDSRITGAEQTANKNVANGYIGADAAGRSTPAHQALVPQIVALTFASTVTIDASTGSLFRVTLTGPMTLAAPTNPSDGQRILVQLAQDATGGRTYSLDPVFNLGPLTATGSTAANKVDYLLAQYRAAATKWDVLAFAAGY